MVGIFFHSQSSLKEIALFELRNFGYSSPKLFSATK
jgi:hypothetical protein